MADLIEYHGWAVLYNRSEDWSCGDWDVARNDVEFAVGQLKEEDGHAVHMNWPADGGVVIALNGWTMDLDPVLAVLRSIGEAASNSYGELTTFPVAEHRSKETMRYELRERTLQIVEP